jgi:hypothetical protein
MARNPKSRCLVPVTIVTPTWLVRHLSVFGEKLLTLSFFLRILSCARSTHKIQIRNSPHEKLICSNMKHRQIVEFIFLFSVSPAQNDEVVSKPAQQIETMRLPTETVHTIFSMALPSCHDLNKIPVQRRGVRIRAEARPVCP